MTPDLKERAELRGELKPQPTPGQRREWALIRLGAQYGKSPMEVGELLDLQLERQRERIARAKAPLDD